MSILSAVSVTKLYQNGSIRPRCTRTPFVFIGLHTTGGRSPNPVPTFATYFGSLRATVSVLKSARLRSSAAIYLLSGCASLAAERNQPWRTLRTVCFRHLATEPAPRPVVLSQDRGAFWFRVVTRRSKTGLGLTGNCVRWRFELRFSWREVYNGNSGLKSSYQTFPTVRITRGQSYWGRSGRETSKSGSSESGDACGLCWG